MGTLRRGVAWITLVQAQAHSCLALSQPLLNRSCDVSTPRLIDKASGRKSLSSSNAQSKLVMRVG